MACNVNSEKIGISVIYEVFVGFVNAKIVTFSVLSFLRAGTMSLHFVSSVTCNSILYTC